MAARRLARIAARLPARAEARPLDLSGFNARQRAELGRLTEMARAGLREMTDGDLELLQGLITLAQPDSTVPGIHGRQEGAARGCQCGYCEPLRRAAALA